jgi:hypothetical protein
MKKPCISIVVLIAVYCVFFSDFSYGQRARRADSIMTFFVGSAGPFDRWWQDSSRQKFGKMGDHDTSFRYYNLEDTLGLNCEFRGLLYDYPSAPYPAPDSIVLGGVREPFLDVLAIEPMQLYCSFEDAAYLRFELERHQQMDGSVEYPGFIDHPGLVGSNDSVDGTAPQYLLESSRSTPFRSVKMKASIDTPGVFNDSIWYKSFIYPDGSPFYFFKGNEQRKLLIKIRAKVDTSALDSIPSTEPVFKMTIFQYGLTDSDTPTDSLLPGPSPRTYRLNSFHHINSDFDTVTYTFKRHSLVRKMLFKFEWQGNVDLTADWMEVMTNHIDSSSTDINAYPNGYPSVVSGEAGANSAVDYLAPNPVELNKLVSRIKKDYMGHVNYVRIGDEFSIAHGLPFKRLVKLMQDSTQGAIEVVPYTVDSGTSWLGGSGIPNVHEYSFEGTRRGWVDSNLYADPKMVFYDPYVLNWKVPLPKRINTALSDTGSLRSWESQFLPNINDTDAFSRKYSPYDYLIRSQYLAYRNYLGANRRGRRWVERQNNGSKFGLDWQAGAGPNSFKNGSSYFIAFTGLRPPTGPEMKVTGHLSASCGSSGLLLYFLANYSPGGGNAENGGVMAGDGTHDSMYYSTTVKIKNGPSDTLIAGRLWMGFKERYDTVRALIPTLITYGSTLLHSKRIGDWLASEMLLAADSLMPFVSSSIRTYNDSMEQDAFSPTTDTTDTVFNHWQFGAMVADTTNRTFVHISVWVDTLGGASDTLLYVTNMRTDDSYDTTDTVTTIDRRLITMKLKRPHIIEDVAFPQGAQLDNEKIWTPYVGTQTGDSLKLFLKAGDGILIRLADTTQGTMRQTRIAMNYPKNGEDFNDHGRIVFNRPVPGVLDKTNSAKWSIPSSSRPYIVGIPDTTTAKMWQDSLLYRTVHSSRTGRWRHQHWRDGSTVKFGFKDSLKYAISQRQPQISTDSLAHNIVINIEYEDSSAWAAKIKFFDPFFVDSTTLVNKYGDSSKSSPFLPQTVDTSGALQGGHHEKYGGIFLGQNFDRDTGSGASPMYTIDAYQTIFPGGNIFNDAPTTYAQWGFLQWTKNDYIHSLDPTPWENDTIARKVNVVFMRDSAIYTARYKAHMAAFESGSGADSGMCCNNQRKLYFEGLDSVGQNVYRIVYNSFNRIYTALGTKTGPNNADFVWQPEELLSLWGDTRFRYPALSRHSAQPIKYHFVYQDDWGSIVMARIDTNHLLDTTELFSPIYTDHAVPVIGSTDVPWGPVDVVAWEAGDSINICGVGDWNNTGERSNIIKLGDHTAHFPTIWVDSCYNCDPDSSKAKFWLAYQRDTVILIPGSPPGPPVVPQLVTDVFAIQGEVQYGSSRRKPNIVMNGNPFSVSRLLTPASFANIRPCISGMRLDTNGTVQVKLAYEALHGPSVGVQGINIANNFNNGGWTNTRYITSMSGSNKFWKPSIEVTKLQKVGTTYTGHLNWYSVVHERNNGTNIQHWGFDSATQRLTSHVFTGLQDPQIAVTPAKIDSHIYRVALDRGASEPRWIIPGYTGAYKLAGNDNLWGYHTVSESDTSGMLYIQYGFGELGVEDEDGLIEFDLKERDEREVIDSAHSADYFMRSEPFVLPASSSLQYCPWVYLSSDSEFQSQFDTMKFVLDFYDTSGVFACRIDSFEITDSLLTVSSDLRQISIDRESNQTGFVVFSRISGVLHDSGKIWNSVISDSKLSVETAYKRAGRNYAGEADNGITLAAIPNPFTDALTLKFSIPNSGPVTIEVFDAMGKMVGFVTESRFYGDGTHAVDWNPRGISKGVYTFKLTFGNYVETVKAIYVE